MVFLFWWTGSSALLISGEKSSVFIALGRLMGLLGELAILFQLILISRITWIEQVFGFDKLNRIHRLTGYSIGGFILIHPLFIITGYALANEVSFWTQFFNFVYNWEDVLNAVIGIIILLAVIVVSISIVRKKLRYETWHFFHVFIYVAIALFFFHQVQTGDIRNSTSFYYYWYVLNFTIFGLLLIYRFARPLYLFYKHRFYIDNIVQETPTVYSFYIKGRNMHEYVFQAGQYMHITFLAKKMWYTHPFSFSIAPNGEYLRVSIKNSGDFTSQVKSLPLRTHVIIEGPYGVFTEKSAKKNKFLFIAGGIGITPIRSLIESLSKKNADMVLLYGNREPQEIAFEQELSTLIARHTHILSTVPKNKNEMNEKYQYGFIDKEKIQLLVPDFQDREVYLCGPPIMMKNVLKVCKELNIPKSQLHYEIFSY